MAHSRNDYEIRFLDLERRYTSFADRVTNTLASMSFGDSQNALELLTPARDELQDGVRSELAAVRNMIAEDRDEIAEALAGPETLGGDDEPSMLLYRQTAILRDLDGASHPAQVWRNKVRVALADEDTVALRVLVDLAGNYQQTHDTSQAVADMELRTAAKHAIATGPTKAALDQRALLDDLVQPSYEWVGNQWQAREYKILVEEGDDPMAEEFILDDATPLRAATQQFRGQVGELGTLRQQVRGKYGDPEAA